MVSVQLDGTHERQLRALAATQGTEVADLTRIIVENYLDALEWKAEPQEHWGEASVALAGEVSPDEHWDGAEKLN